MEIEICNCIVEVNKHLEEMGKNTQLDIPITWNGAGKVQADRISIMTRKADDTKREKPIEIIPAYCPFCGERYA